jgi:hypothetical protein
MILDTVLADFKGEGSVLGLSVGSIALGISGEISTSPSHSLHGVNVSGSLWTGTFPRVDQAFNVLAGKALPELHSPGVSVAGYTYNTETAGFQIHVGTLPLALAATAASVVLPEVFAPDAGFAWHSVLQSALKQ